MWLLFVVILVFLGIILVALKMAFGVFPDGWQWVGIILAGFGLAMSAPSVFQMIIGRPKLLVEYDRIEHGQARSLAVFLKNPPLDDKSAWRKLGIRRDAIQSLAASFRITQVGTGAIIIPIMHARIYSDDDQSERGNSRIALPPTASFETCIMVAMWDETSKVAIVPGDRLRKAVSLQPGVYQIEVIFLVDGNPHKEAKQFIVDQTADSLTWVKPTQSHPQSTHGP